MILKKRHGSLKMLIIFRIWPNSTFFFVSLNSFFYFHSVCLCVYMYVYAHIFLGIIRRTHSCLCGKWKNNKPQQTTLMEVWVPLNLKHHIKKNSLSLSIICSWTSVHYSAEKDKLLKFTKTCHSLIWLFTCITLY